MKTRLHLLFLCLLGCLFTGNSWAIAVARPMLEILRPGAMVPEAAVHCSVLAWGRNNFGQANVPAGLSDVVTVAAGPYHTLALREDGTVVAWGSDRFGECTVPQGLSGVVAVAAGNDYSVALKQDGTVVAWGLDIEGVTAVPAGLTGVKAIAAGSHHTVALKQNGSIVAWGMNNYGQTTVPDIAKTGVVAIAATASNDTFVIKQDGSVYGWGFNFGQKVTQIGASGSGIVSLCTGGMGFYAVTADGNFLSLSWGGITSAKLPAVAKGAVAISLGGLQGVARKGDGSVAVWGDNEFDQKNGPAGATHVVAVASGYQHVVALSKLSPLPLNFGTVNAGSFVENTFKLASKGSAAVEGLTAQIIGANADEFSITGGLLLNRLTPGSSADLVLRFTPKSAGPRTATLRITSNDPDFRKFDLPLMATATAPQIVVKTDFELTSGNTIPFGLATPGAYPLIVGCSLWNTGNGRLDLSAFTVDGATPEDFVIMPAVGAPIDSTVAPGAAKYLVIKFAPKGVGPSTATLHIASNDPVHNVIDLKLTGQGSGLYLSFATGSSRLNWPTQTVDLGWLDTGISVVRRFTVANKGNRPLTGLRLAVESNGGAAVKTTPPLPDTLAVGESFTFSATFTGLLSGVDSASVRLLTDDPNEATQTITFTAWIQAPKVVVNYAGKPVEPANHERLLVCVGDNNVGQSMPPEGHAHVTAIAAGWYHTVALKQDGSVVAWGNNEMGESTVPAGLSNVVAIAAGAFHTVALTGDGNVVAWGANDLGQSTVPKGLSNVVAIAAGAYSTVALKRNGTVVAWGDNEFGQSKVPAGLSGVVAIATGGDHHVALRYDGSIVAWGDNRLGQCTTPAGLTGVEAIAAGYGHTLALKRDGKVIAWGYNNYGEITVPNELSGVTAISATNFDSLALKRDGSMVTWGQYARSRTDFAAGLTGLTAIAPGLGHTVALVDPAGDFGPLPFFLKPGSVYPVLGPKRDHTLTITNPGQLPLQVAATFEGPDANQFSLVGSAPATIAPGASSPLTIRFAPTRLGSMRAALKITGNDPGTPSYTLDLSGAGVYASDDATKSGATGSSYLSYGLPALDRSTGLILQKITFTNPTGVALNGLRVLISSLAPGVSIQSSSATDKPGIVEVIYSKPIAQDETVSLTLTYNDPQRRTNLQPIIHVESLAEPEPRDGPVKGVLVPLVGVRDTINGPLLEWNATPGKTFVVEYSDDNGKTWYSAVHRLLASSTRYLWTDRGQPETWSKPVNKAGRMYRVKRLE